MSLLTILSITLFEIIKKLLTVDSEYSKFPFLSLRYYSLLFLNTVFLNIKRDKRIFSESSISRLLQEISFAQVYNDIKDEIRFITNKYVRNCK